MDLITWNHWVTVRDRFHLIGQTAEKESKKRVPFEFLCLALTFLDSFNTSTRISNIDHSLNVRSLDTLGAFKNLLSCLAVLLTT